MNDRTIGRIEGNCKDCYYSLTLKQSIELCEKGYVYVIRGGQRIRVTPYMASGKKSKKPRTVICTRCGRKIKEEFYGSGLCSECHVEEVDNEIGRQIYINQSKQLENNRGRF